MSIKTVYMVSGNKGGVGKSLFCLALASAFEMRGEQFSILDGDGRTGDVYSTFLRKCPARWGDFRELRPESHNCNRDKAYETMLWDLLCGSPSVIVNTPDGADAILAKWFDATLSHTETNNWVFKFIYLMSDRPDGLEMLPQLRERFQFLYPVRNLHFGEVELFEEFNSNHASGFNEVIDFPALRGEEVRMLFNVQTYPMEALSLTGSETGTHTVPAMSRSRLLKWQLSVNEVIDDIIENIDVPNVKVESE